MRAAWLMRRQKSVERLTRAVAAALGHAVGAAPPRSWRPALVALMPSNGDALVLQQPIEHAPGKGAMGAAALEGQIDALVAVCRPAAACCWHAGQPEWPGQAAARPVDGCIFLAIPIV